MNVTTVPEPGTLALLFLACLAGIIALLVNRKTRVVGFVLLAAPLMLLAFAAVFWYFSTPMLTPQRDMAWQPPQGAITRIGGSDSQRGIVNHVAIPRAPRVEFDDVAVSSASKSATPSIARSALLVFVLLGVLLFGGLAVIVMLLVFRKTRVVGIALLVLGVPIALLLMGAWFVASDRIVLSSMPASEEVSTHWGEAGANPSRDVAKSVLPASHVGIPVEAAEKAEAAKPAVKPAVGMAEATGRALVKAINHDGKKPVAEKPVAEKPDPKPVPASAKGAPAWVNAPPRVVGDAYHKTIVVGPYPTRQDCDAELPNELQKELSSYIELCVGQPAGTTHVALPYEFLRAEVVKGEWEETIQSPSVGAMTQLHVLLQFDHKVKDRILAERQHAIITGRLWMGGAGLAAVLWLLAVMYGYLRIDLATGGAYRGRLRFAAALAILGPVAATMLVVVRAV